MVMFKSNYYSSKIKCPPCNVLIKGDLFISPCALFYFIFSIILIFKTFFKVGPKHCGPKRESKKVQEYTHTHGHPHTYILLTHTTDYIWLQLKGLCHIAAFSGAMWCGLSLPVVLLLKSFGNWEMQRGWIVRMKLIKNAGEHQQPLFSKQALMLASGMCHIKCIFKYISAVLIWCYKLTTFSVVRSLWHSSEEIKCISQT